MPDELDCELRAVAHWIDDTAKPVTVDEVVPVAPNMPRARRGARLAAIGLVAAAAVGGAIALQTRDVPTWSAQETTSTDAPFSSPSDPVPGSTVPAPAAPPAVERAADEPWIWLSASRLPTTGGDLAAIVVNPGSTGFGYGVAGSFERWDGTTWQPAGGWTSSLDFWGGFGTVTEPGDAVAVRLIGLTAGPGSTGATEFVTIPPLDPGWYRLGHEEGAQHPTGMFEVAADAPPLLPLDGQSRGSVGSLTVRPMLLRPTDTVLHLTAQPASDGSMSTEQMTQFTAEFSPMVRIDRWDSGSWATVGEFEAMPDGEQNVSEVKIEFPALVDGFYRATRTHPTGEIHREFWVTSTIVPPAPPIPDTWVPTGPVAFDVVRRGDDANTLVVGLTGADEAWPESNPCWQGYAAGGQVADGVIHLTVTAYRSASASEGPCVCPDESPDECSVGRGPRTIEVLLDQPLPPGATVVDDATGRTDVPFIDVAPPIPTLPEGWRLDHDYGVNSVSVWGYVGPRLVDGAPSTVSVMLGVRTDIEMLRVFRNLEVVSQPTIQGRPAVILAPPSSERRDEILIVADDRYILYLSARVGPESSARDDLIALAESLTPFPISIDALLPTRPTEVAGTVDELLGYVAQVVVNGRLVIDTDGVGHLCDALATADPPTCGPRSMTVRWNGEATPPAGLREVGDVRVSDQSVELRGRLDDLVLTIE